MGMVKKKKHTRAEIATKLVQANELAREGRLQSDIARVLGVSVMTLHRWRIAQRPTQPVSVKSKLSQADDRPRPVDRIAELQLENARLRRLVTDLLLEKIKVEETAEDQASSRRQRV